MPNKNNIFFNYGIKKSAMIIHIADFLLFINL